MARVLVVDDNPGIVTLLTEILSSNGHEVHTAYDGLEMVMKARQLQPQLIIADIMMPGMHGPTAYELLAREPATSSTPAIFLTSANYERAERLIPKSGRVRLLFKPLHIPSLARAMEELLKPK